MKSKLLALILTVFLIPVAYAMFGDANGDGIMDPTDLVKIKAMSQGSYVNCIDANGNIIECTAVFDVNGDGIVSPEELQSLDEQFTNVISPNVPEISNELSTPILLGDANGDGYIDPSDLVKLNAIMTGADVSCYNSTDGTQLDCDSIFGITRDVDGVITDSSLNELQTLKDQIINTIAGLNNLQTSSVLTAEINDLQNVNSASIILGDANGDGIIDPSDLLKLNAMLQGTYVKCIDAAGNLIECTAVFDVDGDGTVSPEELQTLKDQITNSINPNPELPDVDEDNYKSNVDCNDNDASINPDALDNTQDLIDNDCDGAIDEDYVAPVVSNGGGSSGGSSSHNHRPIVTVQEQPKQDVQEVKLESTNEELKVPGITGAVTAETGNSNLFAYLKDLFLKIVSSIKNLFA